ncbi:MAG: ABC transporter ATP-binding protein [Gemmatimonadota bacterium]
MTSPRTHSKPTGPGDAILEGENLVVEVRGSRLLDVDRVRVHGGEILTVLGPNGAGKSTLLRVLTMLQPVDSGTVYFRGRSGREARELLRRECAFVFQRPHLWAGTVRQNLELGLQLRRLPAARKRARAEKAAEQLGIADLMGRDARSLSGGEAQRVAIARAMALDPSILCLDEPASNLDAMARTALIEDLDRVARDRRHATVIATHDRADAFSIADRVIVLRDGRVVQSGRPEDLFENPVDPFIAAVTGAELSFRAPVEDSDEGLLSIRTGNSTLSAVGPARPGDAVRVVYRPEDLFLSKDRIEASPRNRFQARVTEIRSAGSLERVRLERDGQPWVAVITRAAADELSLEAGSEIWVQVKATALHAFHA